jgi:hypothetical protein
MKINELIKKWWFWLIVVIILFMILIPIVPCGHLVYGGGSAPTGSATTYKTIFSFLTRGCPA